MQVLIDVNVVPNPDLPDTKGRFAGGQWFLVDKTTRILVDAEYADVLRQDKWLRVTTLGDLDHKTVLTDKLLELKAAITKCNLELDSLRKQAKKIDSELENLK